MVDAISVPVKYHCYLIHSLLFQNNGHIYNVFWVAGHYHSRNIFFMHVVFYLKLLHIHSILALIPFCSEGSFMQQKTLKIVLIL